jgi:hypothetical protein
MSDTNDLTRAVIEGSKAAAEQEDVQSGERAYDLSTGVRVHLRTVNPSVITEVMSRIAPPDVPEVFIESKGRTEKNPMDPTYLGQMEVWEGLRATAMMDTFVLNGLDLIDGLPEDASWLKELKLLERLGHLDLSVYDLDDEFDLKFLYLKNVAMGADDWGAVFRAFNVTQKGIREAEDTFQR